LYGKISNSKIEESCSLKSCEHSLGTVFATMTFQTFECGWPRHGLKDRKNGQKTQKICILEIFSKVQKRLIKPDKKKITLDIL
jgi:hypothetical protein